MVGNIDISKVDIYHKATNILTQLDKVEKRIPNFGLYYKYISEFCHPCSEGSGYNGPSSFSIY